MSAADKLERQLLQQLDALQTEYRAKAEPIILKLAELRLLDPGLPIMVSLIDGKLSNDA